MTSCKPVINFVKFGTITHNQKDQSSLIMPVISIRLSYQFQNVLCTIDIYIDYWAHKSGVNHWLIQEGTQFTTKQQWTETDITQLLNHLLSALYVHIYARVSMRPLATKLNLDPHTWKWKVIKQRQLHQTVEEVWKIWHAKYHIVSCLH